MLKLFWTGVCCGLLLGCSDSSAPNDSQGAGDFSLELRGGVTADITGKAQLVPAANPGLIQKLNLTAQTSRNYYTLEISFDPAIIPAKQSFSVGPTAPVHAVFYMVNRQTSAYEFISIAQSGTLILETCNLRMCKGEFNAKAALEGDNALMELISKFHAQ